MIKMSTIKSSPMMSIFLLAHIFIIIGYSVNWGIFNHFTQLIFLTLGLLLLIVGFVNPAQIKLNFDQSLINLLLVANSIGFILFYLIDRGNDISSVQASVSIMTLKAIALLLFVLYYFSFNFSGKNIFSAVLLHLSKFKFVYLVIVAIVLRMVVIFSSPQTQIDVYWLLKGAAGDLIQGQNPYAGDYYNVYSEQGCQVLHQDINCKNDNFSYLPGTLVVITFFSFIFGDPRFTYIFSILGACLIIYHILSSKFKDQLEISQLIILLLLYLPLGLYVTEQAWVDQLSVFFLYLFVYLLINNFKYLPYIALGIFLSTKQSMFLFSPFLFKLQGLSLKKIVLTGVTVAIIVLPFFLWSPHDFIEDTLLAQWAHNDAIHSLSWKSFMKLNFSDLSFYSYLSFAVVGALFVFLLRKSKRGVKNILHAGIIFVLGLFLAKRGFANYYHLISAILILLISLEAKDMRLEDREEA